MLGKAAIDPVWYLPGVAARFGVSEPDLRRTLFEETGGMFPELVTRPDLEVLLPPIGGTTVYFFGDVERLADPSTVIACTLLPYDPRFEFGQTLAEASGAVPLNHPHCAKFRVLGGALAAAGERPMADSDNPKFPSAPEPRSGSGPGSSPPRSFEARQR